MGFFCNIFTKKALLFFGILIFCKKHQIPPHRHILYQDVGFVPPKKAQFFLTFFTHWDNKTIKVLQYFHYFYNFVWE